MVNYWDIKIPELTGEESRKAYIYLPDSYQHENAKRYPVLYMFDGHNVFFDSHATYGKCWGMKEYMDKTGLQLIIVAVECNHSPDFGVFQRRFLLPLTPQFIREQFGVV
jgi:predicted alpha/beta superfamily hydrolase